MTDQTDTGLHAVPDEVPDGPVQEQDFTGKRRVLRYKPEWDINGLATIKVGDNPKVVYAGHGTSNNVSVWAVVDGSTEDATEIRLASVATGQVVPDGAEYLGFARPDGAIRHIYRLP